MNAPTLALLLAALPAAAQLLPQAGQEGAPALPTDAPLPSIPGFPRPSAIITEDGDASQLPSSYGAHRAFPNRPDQSAMRLENGAHATLHNPHILKQGDSSDLRESLTQGLNAALAAYTGSWCRLRGGFITTRAEGAAALYAGGDDTQLLADGTALSTWEACSPGIIANHEARVTGYGITISTQGEASPALLAHSWASLQLADCRIITTKHESPALETDADASLRAADLRALQSPCCRIGSGARISITQGLLRGGSPAAIHLRSAPTDGDEGEPARLDLQHCRIDATAGATFRVNNISAHILLDSCTATGSGRLLLLDVSPGTEGAANANGGQAILHATDSQLGGDIRVGVLSSASITLGSGTRWQGTAEGNIHLSLRKGAQWQLRGASRIRALDFGGDSVQEGLRRVESGGFDISYDAAASPALEGGTYTLPGGGTLHPAKPAAK